MNEDKLAALFSDAAGVPPEAAFGTDDIARASRRITMRRRAALSGAAALVVVLGGTGVVLSVTREQGTQATVASAPEVTPLIDGPAGGADRAAGSAPLGPGVTPCADRQDPALRTLLDEALPEVVGAPEAASSDVCLPGGERFVTVEVGGGVVGASYLPPGTAVSLVKGAVGAPTASGGTVIVHSGAAGAGPAPFEDRLPAVLAYLAPLL